MTVSTKEDKIRKSTLRHRRKRRRQTDEEYDWTRHTEEVTYYESPFNKHLNPSGAIDSSYSNPFDRTQYGGSYKPFEPARADVTSFCSACTQQRSAFYTPQVMKALEGADYLKTHTQEQDDLQQVVKDYKYVSLVIDRLCLWIYSAVCIIGSMAMLLNAPRLYDPKKPIA